MKRLDEQELMEAFRLWRKAEAEKGRAVQERDLWKRAAPQRPETATLVEWNIHAERCIDHSLTLHQLEVQYSEARESHRKAEECLVEMLPQGVWLKCGEWLVRKHGLGRGYGTRLQIQALGEVREDVDVAAKLELPPKWKVGDIAAIRRPGDPIGGVVIIEAIAERPANEAEKHFAVRAISPYVDWSTWGNYDIAMKVVREPGEKWNAHYGELAPIV